MSWPQDKSRYQRQKQFAKRQIDEAVKQAYHQAGASEQRRSVFAELLLALQGATDLLCPTPDHCRWSDACLYVHGLANLAARCQDFIRPARSWTAPNDGQRGIFVSLVRHLLMTYRTPRFMMSAWLCPASDIARQRQAWHIGMGRGLSIRRMDLPVRMTRRMEDLFLKAPDHFSIEQAIRFSQVLAMGGDKNLADAVVATRMGVDLEHDDFWETVIQFFVNAKGMMTEHVNPIVDFLYYIRFAKREVASKSGTVPLDPPCPNLSMKGRSLGSIMRMVERWHGDLAKCDDHVGLCWPKVPIEDFVYLEEARDPEGKRYERIWSISQLLSSGQLTEEGRSMGHCAGTYGLACFKAKTSVWSMRKESNQAVRRELTIEVDPTTRTIRQARGRHNRMPSGKSLEILRRWAMKERLNLGQHL